MSAAGLNGTGLFVAVVGPSGAGKDTLLDAARRHFAGRRELHFVRRIITRPAEAGGEDHDGVSQARFAELGESNSFAVSWQAHGLSYAIPRAECRLLETCGMVVGNGSRGALTAFAEAFPRLVVLNVTARPEILAGRLESRGRESHAEIAARLARERPIDPTFHTVTVDNSGSLAEGCAAMIAALEGLLGA